MGNIVKISKAKKKSKSRVGFLGLFLVAAIVCFFLLSPLFSINAIEVAGNETMTDKYIISASDIFFGDNILRINKFDAINKINDLPLIESAEIKRNWPDKIVIKLEEKDAIAETSFYGSKLIVSDTGDVIDIITDNEETDLPVIEGITVKDVKLGDKVVCKEEENLKKYLEVLKMLKENDMLSEVKSISDKDGILVSFKVGHVAFLEDVDNLPYKINVLKEVWKKEENPAYIDLHNIEKVITKPVWGIFENSTVDNYNDEQIRGAEGEE